MAGRGLQVPVPTLVLASFMHPTGDKLGAYLIRSSVLTYFFRFWGDLVHQSAPPTDGSSLPTAALLHKLLPGRPDLVDEAVRSVRERRPWKKVGITNNLGHLT